MSEQQILLKKKRPRTGFTQVPNDLLCSDKISGLAKALWCLLFSKPENWTFFWGEILSNFKEGRDSVKKAAKELEESGYLIKKQTKKSLNGKMIFGGMEIELDDQPTLENSGAVPITEFQLTEIPSTESSLTEKAYTYKQRSKKDLSKKDLSSLPSEEEAQKFADDEELKIDVKKWLKISKHGNLRNWQQAMIAYAENPKNQVIKKNLTTESKQIQILRTDIRDTLLYNASANDIYFAGRRIESTEDGHFIIFCDDKKALKYESELAKINVKIEVK